MYVYKIYLFYKLLKKDGFYPYWVKIRRNLPEPEKHVKADRFGGKLGKQEFHFEMTKISELVFDFISGAMKSSTKQIDL